MADDADGVLAPLLVLLRKFVGVTHNDLPLAAFESVDLSTAKYAMVHAPFAGPLHVLERSPRQFDRAVDITRMWSR
jgi:hypothetical protein